MARQEIAYLTRTVSVDDQDVPAGTPVIVVGRERGANDERFYVVRLNHPSHERNYWAVEADALTHDSPAEQAEAAAPARFTVTMYAKGVALTPAVFVTAETAIEHAKAFVRSELRAAGLKAGPLTATACVKKNGYLRVATYRGNRAGKLYGKRA